jgi:hypothetical protein
MLQAVPEAALLERNLRALAQRDPELALRLCWPLRADHVEIPDSGPALRRGLPFAVPAGEVEATLNGVEADREVLLLGVGLGEQLDALLARKLRGLTAWDRDPYLLRLLLMRRDLSAPLETGRLRLALGTDLVELLASPAQVTPLWNPLLEQTYRTEAALVRAGVGARRALVGVDRLLSDDLADALRAEGYCVCPVDFDGWALEEIARTFARTAPALVADINYRHGLVEFCAQAGVPYLCWEIDPATDRIEPPACATDRAFVFSYRRAGAEAFRMQGFANAEHLPLASNPERRRPSALAPGRAPDPAPVSFVGSSLAREARSYRRRFLALYREWHPASPDAEKRCDAIVERCLEEQRRDFSHYVLADALERELGPFLAGVRSGQAREDPVALLDDVAAAEKRRSYVAALGRFGIDVWGDPGWQHCSVPGVRYRGWAGHLHELSGIYASPQIHVDIGRIYQQDIVTLRVFDVLACGGFVLAEHSSDLEELFELGVEIESYRTLAELEAKIERYRADPQLARTIAQRGRAAVCERHTIRERVRRMLARLEASLAG